MYLLVGVYLEMLLPLSLKVEVAYLATLQLKEVVY